MIAVGFAATMVIQSVAVFALAQENDAVDCAIQAGADSAGSPEKKSDDEREQGPDACVTVVVAIKPDVHEESSVRRMQESRTGSTTPLAIAERNGRAGKSLCAPSLDAGNRSVLSRSLTILAPAHIPNAPPTA